MSADLNTLLRDRGEHQLDHNLGCAPRGASHD